MKLFLLASVVFCVIFSCKKTETSSNYTLPVTPVTPSEPVTKPDILVSGSWEIDEVYITKSGALAHYLKGGENTTGTTYGSTKVTLNANGTGTYVDESGISHAATWQFTDAIFRNLQLSIGAPNATTFNWNLMEIALPSVHTTTVTDNNITSCRWKKINTTETFSDKTSLLTKYSWTPDEVYRNTGGINTHYLKGGSNNTSKNYDIPLFSFNANNTGIYRDEEGNKFSTTWRFLTADQRNLEVNAATPVPSIFKWNLLELGSEAIHTVMPEGSNILSALRMVRQPDTVLTKQQMLITGTWQMDEILRNQYGYNTHYVRGGINTTGTNYDIMQITFLPDGSATYKDETGFVHTASWQFTTDDKSSLQLNVNAPNAATFNWKLVELSNNFMQSVTPFGYDILLSTRMEKVHNNRALPNFPLNRRGLLTKQQWKLDEVRRNIQGVNTYYIRGGGNTTGTNYDVVRFTFNTNGTGIYINESGISKNMTWQFTSPDERKLKLIIEGGADEFNWDMLEITNDAMYNTTDYISRVLLSARLKPAP